MTSRNELGEVGEALSQAIVGMQTALRADTVEWSEVGKQRDEVGRIRQMVENAPINMALADAALKVQYANPAFIAAVRHLAGHVPVGANELIGASLTSFPGHLATVLGDPESLPHRARVTIGPEVIDLVATAIRDQHGDFLGPMITWEMVTERLAAERTLEESQARERVAADERRRYEQESEARERQVARERAAQERAADEAQRGATDTRQAAEELARTAVELQSLLRRFRIEASEPPSARNKGAELYLLNKPAPARRAAV